MEWMRRVDAGFEEGLKFGWLFGQRSVVYVAEKESIETMSSLEN